MLLMREANHRVGICWVTSQPRHKTSWTRTSVAVSYLFHSHGEMSEWLKEHAWKACVGETLPWVRIPLSPPPQNQQLTEITRILRATAGNPATMPHAPAPLPTPSARVRGYPLSRASACTI